jgi:hypothetical protein
MTHVTDTYIKRKKRARERHTMLIMVLGNIGEKDMCDRHLQKQTGRGEREKDIQKLTNDRQVREREREGERDRDR